jgi:hypothetical protein
MGIKKQIGILMVAATLMAAFASGCGSGDSSSSTSSDSSSGNATTPSESAGIASFLKKGSKNKIATFGQEASAEEREAASSVLEENLQTRAAGDWASQCSTLAAATIKKEVEEAPIAQGIEGCAKQLEAQAKPLSITKGVRANTMTASIGALRVKGDKAFALYHGTKGVDYSMPMEKEGDEWKVASLTTTKLP